MIAILNFQCHIKNINKPPITQLHHFHGAFCLCFRLLWIDERRMQQRVSCCMKEATLQAVIFKSDLSFLTHFLFFLLKNLHPPQISIGASKIIWAADRQFNFLADFQIIRHSAETCEFVFFTVNLPQPIFLHQLNSTFYSTEKWGVIKQQHSWLGWLTRHRPSFLQTSPHLASRILK